jgi:hypothetical protein
MREQRNDLQQKTRNEKRPIHTQKINVLAVTKFTDTSMKTELGVDRAKCGSMKIVLQPKTQQKSCAIHAVNQHFVSSALPQ